MSFAIHSESKEGYLLFVVSGDYSLPATLEGIDRVLNVCGENKAAKVLVDVQSVTGSVPEMDRFYFGEAFAAKYFAEKKSGRIGHIRFAFFGHFPTIDAKKFGETVAVNRGMTLKVTTDLKEAMDWLLV